MLLRSLPYLIFIMKMSCIHFSDLCDTVLTSPAGMISSPNYPEFYPSNEDCNMTIVTDESPIKLNFEAFDVGSAEYASILHFSQIHFTPSLNESNNCLLPVVRYCLHRILSNYFIDQLINDKGITFLLIC